MTNKVIRIQNIDPRIKDLSYSSLNTLHSCPRKWQLYRLRADSDEMNPLAETNQNLTFAYGHMVGEGIQQVLLGRTQEQITFNLFQDWHADLEDRNPKQNKSFYLALNAVNQFIHMREYGFLEDWELVYWKGKPAVELSFRVTFPDGFKLRGSVDAVLRNKLDGRIMVLECKTSSMSYLNPAQFKNSAQGVGYSVVLDVMFPELSSYEVLYLVQMTKSNTYEQLPFVKTHLQRATWIQEILLDIETIKMYESVGVYPMRGESCFDFFRECEYLTTCALATKWLMKPYDADEHTDTKIYDVELTLQDLIDGQLSKADAIDAKNIHGEDETPIENVLIYTEEGDTLL